MENNDQMNDDQLDGFFNPAQLNLLRNQNPAQFVPRNRNPAQSHHSAVEQLIQQIQQQSFEDDHRPKVDNSGLLESLPTFKFNPEQFKNCSSENQDKLECRVCMCDFESGDELRQLTCFHHYHKTCIDKWFETSSKCPLCNQE